MKARSALIALSTTGLFAVAGCALAQPQGMKPGGGMQDREDMPMRGGSGMMGGQGMHGHHGMMGGRRMMGPGMMAGGMMGGGHPLPQLPPGNEKLELQMHAEMMQRMGEILAKYAARIKE